MIHSIETSSLTLDRHGQKLITIFAINLNIYFAINFQRPCVRINCYNNADWPNENKDEIDKAIKKCLEVVFCFLFITFF